MLGSIMYVHASYESGESSAKETVTRSGILTKMWHAVISDYANGTIFCGTQYSVGTSLELSVSGLWVTMASDHLLTLISAFISVLRQLGTVRTLCKL